LGTQYNLLREQFKNCKERIINKNLSNILITMGGSDVLDLTTTFIKYVNEFNERLNINVVVGPAFLDKKAIEKETYKLSNVTIYHSVKNMAKLMYDNDLAISSAGTTLY